MAKEAMWKRKERKERMERMERKEPLPPPLERAAAGEMHPPAPRQAPHISRTARASSID